MNADRLLAQYEQIADAPNAINRLRRLIIDLAVRGKLVASTGGTWTTIQIEKCLEILNDGRRIHQGWSPQCESHPSPSEEVWGVLKTTAIQDGFFLEEQNKELPRRLKPRTALEVRPGDVLITCAGPRARCGIACLVRNTRKRLLISGKMYRFRANAEMILADYLALYFRSHDAQVAINAMKTGSSESGLNLTQDRFKALKVSFGPLAEQRRIVEKVDELMVLCDRLEAARTASEATRDRLAAVSLSRINKPDPETFRDDARFVLAALPALTARSDQIKALRQSILNLAVSGNLVPQDPCDEPAIEYLHRLSDMKPSRKGQLAPVDPDDAGGRIPASWAWIPLGVIARGMDAGWSPQCENERRSTENQWAVLKTTAVQALSFDASQNKLLPTKLEPRPRHQAEVGDILVTRAGPKNRVGVSCVVDVPCPRLMISDKLIRFHPIGEISPRYVALALNAGRSNERLEMAKSGMAVMQMNISQDKLRAIPIPLPPLGEQCRIVAKVDELIALCDRLEDCLKISNDTRHRLLGALLADAIRPATADEMDDT